MRVVLVLAMLLCTPMVFGLGISHEYLPDKELVLSPGQNYVFKLIIQNEVEEPVTINASLESEIATLIGGGIVKIPAETFDRYVLFNITVPRDATIGETYPLKYVVVPIDEVEGQVPFAIKYERVIFVRVDEGEKALVGAAIQPGEELLSEEPQQVTQWILWPLLIVVIAGMLVMLWRKSSAFTHRLLQKKETMQAPSEPVVAKEMHVDVTEPVEKKPTPVVEQKTVEQKVAGVVSPAVVARARPEHTFNLSNGKNLFTLHELLHELQTNPEVCAEHLNGNFVAWVREELRLPELAEKMGGQTIEGLIGVLQDALA